MGTTFDRHITCTCMSYLLCRMSDCSNQRDGRTRTDLTESDTEFLRRWACSSATLIQLHNCITNESKLSLCTHGCSRKRINGAGPGPVPRYDARSYDLSPLA